MLKEKLKQKIGFKFFLFFLKGFSKKQIAQILVACVFKIL